MALHQNLLKLHPVQARHANVHDQTGGSSIGFAGEEVSRRGKGFTFVAGRSQKPGHAFSHGSVVIDQEHECAWSSHAQGPILTEESKIKKRAPTIRIVHGHGTTI